MKSNIDDFGLANLSVSYTHLDVYKRQGMPNNTVEVIIEKNRSGARGTVELIFQKEYNKFSSISKREDQ